MPFHYEDVEALALMLTDSISEREQVHLSQVILRATITADMNKRTRRIVEVLADDIEKLEAEFRE